MLEEVLAYVPVHVRDTVGEYLDGTRTPRAAVNEVRLRVGGAVALVVSGRNVTLPVQMDKDEMRECFRRITGGAPYAHRDDVCRGFIALEGGIRVGVCAEARYERDKVIGVGDHIEIWDEERWNGELTSENTSEITDLLIKLGF